MSSTVWSSCLGLGLEQSNATIAMMAKFHNAYKKSQLSLVCEICQSYKTHLANTRQYMGVGVGEAQWYCGKLQFAVATAGGSVFEVFVFLSQKHVNFYCRITKQIFSVISSFTVGNRMLLLITTASLHTRRKSNSGEVLMSSYLERQHI